MTIDMAHNSSNPEQPLASNPTSTTAIRRLNGQGETLHFTLEERLGDTYIDRSELKIIKKIGEGGFATVQLGKWKGRDVAIKTLFEDMFANEREVLSFLTEVRLLRKIDHPHIVKFLGAGGSSLKEEDLESPRQTADLFLVQEFCIGGSLKHLVSLQMIDPFAKLYSDADALRWSIQIASAVDYMHTANPKVVHRDLKLDNCLLTSKRWTQADCKLADFGLAKLFRQTTLSRMITSQLELSWGPGIDDDPLWIKGSVFHRKHLEQVFSAEPTGISIEAANLTGQTGSFA
jgi:serine/threonine protein kinase